MKWYAKLMLLLLSIPNTSLWTMEAPGPQETVGTKREWPKPGQEERPEKIRKIEVESEPVPAPMEIEQEKKERKQKYTLEPRKIEPYYTKENLERLRKQGIQLHAPCIVIFDIKNKENPSINTHGALTLHLFEEIQNLSMPIITSNSILFNLLERAETIDDRKHPENKYYSLFKLLFSEWQVYKTLSSQLIILIPKRFSDNYSEMGIKFSNLENLSHLLPGAWHGTQKIENYRPLQQAISLPLEILSPIDIVHEFNSIFLTKDDISLEKVPIWDFIFEGHGTTYPKPTIVGLSSDQINEIFSFIDQKLNAGIIYLLSCNAGGKNLSLLQFEKFGVTRNHNFILIVGAITDSPTALIDSSDMCVIFFNLAAQLADKGESLNNLLNSITLKNPGIHSVNIPQIWLPNGMGFQTCNIDKNIFVLGNVLAKTYLDEKQTILISNKVAVLVYAPSIFDLSVFPATPQLELIKLEIEKKKMKIWPLLPMIHESYFWKDVTVPQKLAAQKQLQKEFPKFLKKYTSLFFPQFISMIPGSYTNNHFNEIFLLKGGIINFIRDSFLDIAQRTSAKFFYIEKLHGINDISLLIQASRLKRGINEPHLLEKLLVTKKNKTITLDKVIIYTQFNPSTYANEFKIMFSIDNTAWEFSDKDITNRWFKTYSWNFIPTDLKKLYEFFNKMYESIKKETFVPEPAQKPISQVLKQKQAEIKRKQELHKQQKEAAESAIKKWKTKG